MGRPTTHQTNEDKNLAKALVNQRARAKKAEEEHNLLSCHPDQTVEGLILGQSVLVCSISRATTL